MIKFAGNLIKLRKQICVIYLYCNLSINYEHEVWFLVGLPVSAAAVSCSRGSSIYRLSLKMSVRELTGDTVDQMTEHYLLVRTSGRSQLSCMSALGDRGGDWSCKLRHRSETCTKYNSVQCIVDRRHSSLCDSSVAPICCHMTYGSTDMTVHDVWFH